MTQTAIAKNLVVVAETAAAPAIAKRPIEVTIINSQKNK